ncbi:hypothetical protein BOX37_07755 [Nocardia mangyaensis]|uniref:Uncharacterized protein n=1 Tax=Nocardia mangyaensis TaxID=2213200 RepID=A0A1J0VPE3_9NOCA|nr:hypothetical protein [Nocardia mangyaensis]APE33882.1 hypothetical protein BOX37_07755 [Nocardia mangyaensis]
MPTWLNLLLAGVAGVGAIALLASVVVMATRWPGDPGSASAARPAPGGDAGSTPPASDAASGIWPYSWTHDVPDQPFTADEAHREMQVHRICRLDGCGRKAVAFQTLIDAGRVRPDTSRQPY